MFAQVALAATLINVLAMATALFSMAVYNKVVPNDAVDSMAALVIGISLVIAFDFLLRGLRGYFVDIAGQNIDRVLGEALFDRLLGMKLADRRSSNGAFAGLLRAFETLREFFASATITALVDVPFVLLFTLVIAIIAPPLVVVPLLAIPIVIGTALAAQPLLTRLSAANFSESLNKQGVITETIAGLETVKSSLAGPMLARRWRAAVGHHAALSLRQRCVAAIAVNVAAAMQSIAYVAVLTLGVVLIAEQALSMGALVAASMLVGRAVAPLGQIAALLTRLSHTQSAYCALDRVMTTAGEANGSTPGRRAGDAAPLRRPVLDGRIAFRRVSFRYPGSTMLALDDVSFDTTPGERVAIIGKVGSGKSTIARLILGLYTPESGAVMLDDADVRQLHPDDLRRNVGSVLQDVVLLSGTIRDNIALGDASVDDSAVLRAARLSGAARRSRRRAFGWPAPDGRDCPRFGTTAPAASLRRADKRNGCAIRTRADRPARRRIGRADVGARHPSPVDAAAGDASHRHRSRPHCLARTARRRPACAGSGPEGGSHGANDSHRGPARP